jgi:hypothetical protein
MALLVGAFLRSNALGPMNDMLHYDEAYDGLDALSLLRHFRLTPFFPGNYGREAGWIYFLMPFVAVFGAQPFSLRLAAVITGVLCLAAEYRLGAEILGKRAATWAAVTLAVFYWPIHVNHLALRANLFPLVGALALAALFRARRTRKLAHWMIAGALLGFLAYIYYSALAWLMYALLLLAWWIVADPQKRRGSLVAMCAAAAVCLPMIMYHQAHPKETGNRIEMVGTLGPAQVEENVRLWAQAWFQHGDSNTEFNLPGRPILDPALGILSATGLAVLLLGARTRRLGPWILGLAVFSLLPSLLSNQAPHFLRAIGLPLPIALVGGTGAWAIETTARRRLNTRFAFILPLGLLIATGTIAYRDFHVRWLQHPELPFFMEQPVNQAINFMRDHVPAEMPTYFSPFTLSHPVLAFRGQDLAPRRIGAFDSHYCMVIPDGSATYFSLTRYEPAFGLDLSRWADLTVLHREPLQPEGGALYTVYQATTRPGFADPGSGIAVFGDAVQMSLLLPVSSVAKAGDVLTVTLGLKAQHPLARDYSVFVHLYGDPTPYEGGTMWAQGDSQACATYPSHLWQTSETIVQDFMLRLPLDLAPGTYKVAVGIYESPAGARLPITWPEPRANDYIELQRVAVQRPSDSP